MNTRSGRFMQYRATVVLAQLGVGLALWQSLPALAQLEEVLVTAQKREQPLFEVPASITVFSAADIQNSRMERFSDYALRSPNVGFSNPSGDRSDVRFSIRGIGPISSGGLGNSVGVYVDEVNISPNLLARTVDTQLQDASSIEILRGPQGTFFGRNTVGGAVSITSIKPDPEAFSGHVKGEYSSFDTAAVEGAVNVPLSDQFAVRILGYYDESDGYLTQQGPYDNVDATTNNGQRLAMRWLPGENTTVDLAGTYSEQKQKLPTFVPTGDNSESVDLLTELVGAIVGRPLTINQLAELIGAEEPTPNGVFSDNKSDVNTDIGAPSKNETTIATMRLVHDFDDVLLTVVGGYIDNTYDIDGEGDYSSNPSFTVARSVDFKAYSFEARLSGETDKLTWLAGVYYGEDKVDQHQTTTHLTTDPFATNPIPGIGLDPFDLAFFCIGGTSGVPGCPTQSVSGFQPYRIGVDNSFGLWENVDFGSEVESTAVFFDLTYALTDKLDVSFGGRYTDESVSGYRIEGPLADPFAPRESNPGVDEGFDDFSPRVAAIYQLTADVNLYSTISTGFRSGGPNPVADNPNTPSDESTFDQETITNYEVGVKGTALDGKLQGSFTVFYMDWGDIQIRTQDPITQRQLVQNASEAENQGAELQLIWLPWESLSLTVTYGYLDAQFGDFPDAGTLDGDRIDASGNDVPNSPKNTFSAVARYYSPSVDLSGQELRPYIQTEYTYMDEIQSDVADNPRRLNPSYELVNLRLGFDVDRYEVQMFVENLMDETYRYGTNNLETYLSGAQASVGEGRRIGISIRANF
jgi:iron complex outermembrane recepter protein